MHNNSYITRFVLIMTAVVALILALLSTGLADVHKKNEEIFNKRAILSSVKDYLPTPLDNMKDEEILEQFKNIVQVSIDVNGKIVKDRVAEEIVLKDENKKQKKDRVYPVFIFKNPKTNNNLYILSIRGNGLWDAIWGYIALDNNKKIVGAAFDHAAETPGLGAEIKDNPTFSTQFLGKEIMSSNGSYKSVAVVKGGIKDPMHQVDAISGATITSDGVSDMLYNGIEIYLPYLNNIQ